jgi:acyl carrier protein
MDLKLTESSILSESSLSTERSRGTNDILNIIYQAAAELNLQLSEDKRLERSLDTALFGDKGTLDSMALANLIIITEQMLEERFGFRIDLTQDDPFSPTTGHFKTVGSLVSYVSNQLNQ